MDVINKRFLSILLLGFASGLPLALTSSTLQAWFTQSHLSLMSIGALSLLGLPYTLKFLWAPLMDYYRVPKWGRRKGFVLLSQIGMVISLVLLAQLTPQHHMHAMLTLALCLAFLSASQDVAINAYQTDLLTQQERGLGVAYSVFAYRIAMLISGGFALVLADHIGWRVTYDLMAGLMLMVLLSSRTIPQPLEAPPNQLGLWRNLHAGFYQLLQREKIVWLILFILFYKLGDALALSLMTNFLLYALQFSLTQVGIAYKVGGIVATILGTFIGGLLLMRMSTYRALLLFGLAQAFSNLMFVLLAYVGKVFALMTATIFIENFCSGLSTAALLAFMMALCDHRYTASQFALLSAVASLGRVFLGPLASLLVTHVGWVAFYVWSCVLCCPGIFALVMLKSQITTVARLARSPNFARVS